MQANSNASTTYDFIIIGAGIMGLTIARELKSRQANYRILIVEKEASIGKHASGRNSGVLHSGIYYPPESLKATFCSEGATALTEYCDTHQLPIAKIGKVIIPCNAEEDKTLNLLYERGQHNASQAELIDAQQLKELEPETQSYSGRALYCPRTAVIDPLKVLQHIEKQLLNQGVDFIFNSRLQRVETSKKQLRLNGSNYGYGHIFNTAGLHTDRIAHAFSLGDDYTMLPFKGLYYQLNPQSKITINRLIYPVPDLNVPFLGIHFTKSVTGTVYVGPTALPALGRENYRRLKGINPSDMVNIGFNLMRQYLYNKQYFRRYTHREITTFLKSPFTKAARTLVPALQKSDLQSSQKVGIRAQLVDRKNKELVMDFKIINSDDSTHILNAISPAFTCSFSFSKYVVDQVL